MAANIITKFVLKQFAKRSARKSEGIAQLLKASDSVIQSNVKNIEIILKNMGIDPKNLKSTDDVLKHMNIHKAMMNQSLKQGFKGLDLDKGIKSLEKTKKPWHQGWDPKIVKTKPEDKKIPMFERHQKEIKDIDTKSEGMGFYSEMSDLMERQRLEELELDYDTMFNKILEKAKRIDADPKVLLEAELGKKITGKETTTQLLDLFKNRPKKASGGRVPQLQSGGLAYMLGEPNTRIEALQHAGVVADPRGLYTDPSIYTKGEAEPENYYAGGGVGHGPWTAGHKAPEGNQGQDETPVPHVASKPDPLKAPRGLPSVAPKNMDPQYMQQQMMQKAMMGRGPGNMGQGPRSMAAEGGIMRAAFKNGGQMSRRGFMKLIAGLAALPVVGKYFKAAKPIAKVAETFTHVPIKDIPGMPVWFKPLVAKVIKEGTDVTKKYAVKDMEVVHHAKLPGSGTDVIVTQQLDTGDVLVDIGLGKHGWSAGRYGQPARLEYKAAEDIMTGPSDEPFKSGMKRDPFLKIKTEVHEDLVGSGLKGDPKSLHLKPGKTKEEFFVDEAEFTGGHPENVKFEESVGFKYGEHGSDFSEVERYAIGKNKDKKIIGKQAEKDAWAEGRAESQAEEFDEFASGGLAHLLGE